MELNTVEAVLPFTWGVSSLALSPDGSTVMTSYTHSQGTVRFWDAFTGQPRDPPISLAGRADGLAASVDKAVFSQNGRLIATACDDRTARVWDAATRQPVGPSMLHDDPVVGISFDPQAKVVATAAGKQVRFWNVATGKREERRLVLPEDCDRRRVQSRWQTAGGLGRRNRPALGCRHAAARGHAHEALATDLDRGLQSRWRGEFCSRMQKMQPVSGMRIRVNQPARLIHGGTDRAAGLRPRFIPCRQQAARHSRLSAAALGRDHRENVSAANSLLEAHYVALSPDGRHLVIARKRGPSPDWISLPASRRFVPFPLAKAPTS